MDKTIIDKTLLLVLLYVFASFELNAFFMLFFMRQRHNQMLENKRLIISSENTIEENGYCLLLFLRRHVEASSHFSMNEFLNFFLL